MIQRIQTLYLLVAVLITGGAFFTPLFDRFLADPSAWVVSAFVTASVFSAGISIWSILLFKDRPNQTKKISRAMIFQIIAIGSAVGVFFTSGNLGSNLMGEAIGVALISLALILQYLARAAVLKDEELVKSIDRIR